ncbi:CYTH-like domain-containing protein [Polychytrium aggregatum]|uniref:CYTH-like domain-containing protein n=1 Tax=Polychytrium aggregatum TaxID=110093 RepID=UPI0022FF32BD|nr:CYTH-like domain-containing protein [Polychytrium aggregatum]KAI9206949.1 CYTH-like domain-containing protein [Polychytrium aggregatum]
MEIEVKIRLPDRQTFDRALSAFERSSELLAKELQENYYFDTTSMQLERADFALRLRRTAILKPEELACGDSKGSVVSTIALKSKPILVDGISTVQELEDIIDDALVNQILDNPDNFALKSKEHPILMELSKRFPNPSPFRLLGKFVNTRLVFSWLRFVVELDRTEYDFGEGYEIELEHSDAEAAKGELTQFLETNDIPYTFSKGNKLSNMVLGKIV